VLRHDVDQDLVREKEDRSTEGEGNQKNAANTALESVDVTVIRKNMPEQRRALLRVRCQHRGATLSYGSVDLAQGRELGGFSAKLGERGESLWKRREYLEVE